MAPTQLEIKIRALERLMKEESYYQQELKDQQAYVDSLKSDKSVDPYDLKKQEEVLEDTERLLPTLYNKIEQFKTDLESYLETLQPTEDVESPKKLIDKANQLLKSK